MRLEEAGGSCEIVLLTYCPFWLEETLCGKIKLGDQERLSDQEHTLLDLQCGLGVAFWQPIPRDTSRHLQGFPLS